MLFLHGVVFVVVVVVVVVVIIIIAVVRNNLIKEIFLACPRYANLKAARAVHPFI